MRHLPRHEVRAAGCEGKATFRSFSLAAATRQQRERSRVSAPRMPYHCPVCHLWHLGGLALGGDRARDRTQRELAMRRDERKLRGRSVDEED